MPSTSPIISSEADELILVDPEDRVVGYERKDRCHDGPGLLHRALSVFVFNQRAEMLLQKRSSQKRLWPLYWSNSCCSHPRRNETISAAAQRRVSQELGLEVEVHECFRFQYHAMFENVGSENELCYVFVARSDEPTTTNQHEIAATRFVSLANLEKELQEAPHTFTPWFKLEWEKLRHWPWRQLLQL